MAGDSHGPVASEWSPKRPTQANGPQGRGESLGNFQAPMECNAKSDKIRAIFLEGCLGGGGGLGGAVGGGGYDALTIPESQTACWAYIVAS